MNDFTSKKSKCMLSFNWYSVNQVERKDHFDLNTFIVTAFKSKPKHNISTALGKYRRSHGRMDLLYLLIFLAAEEVQNIIKKQSLVYFLIKSLYSFNISFYIYAEKSLL